MIAKRLFDLILVSPALIILAPFFALASVLIKLDSPGPVFFRQERVGRFGVPFSIYKFRTMVADAERSGPRITIGRDPRITAVGAVLRKYKLDELPQLLNVLKGEMSLVGPRPEVAEYVAYYSDQQKSIVHSVPPGITDPASIEFRNENELLSKATDPELEYAANILPKKIELYTQYVNHRSFWGDLLIIFRTLRVLGR